MRLVARCADCTFDNPRGWVTCARCGALLGPQLRSRGADIARGTEDADDDAPTDLIDKTELEPRPPRDQAHDAALDARPFLGQGAVRESLERSLQAAQQQRKARLLSITGEPGAGRTHALQRASEICARLESRLSVQYAACGARDEGPYAPFSRLLLERFGITPASSPRGVRGLMATTVTEVLGPTQAGRVAETTHLLGHVAGVPFPDSPFLRRGKSHPQALLDGAVAALARFVGGEAKRRPQLILLDDLDQAEAPALALVRGLLALDAPLLMVCSGRPELLERLQKLPADRTLHCELQMLTEPETVELLGTLVPGLSSPPRRLLDLLLQRTGGNPGELVSLLGALQSKGLFRTTDDGNVEVVLSRLEEGALPTTSRDSLRARLQSLPDNELHVLRSAAVVGERFWDGALLALQRAEQPLPEATLAPLEVWRHRDDEVAIADALLSLSNKGFIQRLSEAREPGLNEYTFQSSEVRDLLYAALDGALRVMRHGVVARWLAANPRLSVESLAALVAPHFERAGSVERAARAYLSAAGDERNRMRTTMALRYTDKALSLIAPQDVPRRMEALHGRGALLTTLGRYDEAYAAFHSVLRLSWAVGARGTGGAALNRLARIHRQRGENEQALAHLRAALVLFRSSDDVRGVASCYDDMAQLHRLHGDLEAALSAANEALQLRARSQDRRGQAVSLNTVGYIELDRGRYDAAAARFRQALKMREDVGDHEGAVQTRIALGRLAFHRGKLAEAIGIYRQALHSAREMDNRRFQSYLLSHLSEALIASDQLAEAARALSEARSLALDMRDQRVLADIERNQGLLSLRRGDEGAEKELNHALKLALEYGSREAIALAHRSLGRMRARTLWSDVTRGREVDLAAQAFREGVRAFQACGNRPEAARTQAELGYHLMERGERQAARAVLREAHETMRQLNLPERGKVREALDTI